MNFLRFAAIFLVFAALTVPVVAQTDEPVQLGPRAAPTAHVQVGSLPNMDTTPAFDAEKATERYLDRINGPARARSDAYFEGGYWLQLLDLIYGLAVAGLLLWTQLSVRIRDWA